MDIPADAFHAAFVVLAAASTVVFVRRRTIDPLLVGFVSSLIYFMPGLFGSIRFTYGLHAGDFVADIVPGTFVVMAMVIGTLTAGALAYDRVVPHRPPAPFTAPLAALPLALMLIMVTGAAVSAVTVGKGYFCQEKPDVLSRIDIWYYIAAYAAPLCMLSAIAQRSWPVAAIAAGFLLFDLFIGFRGSTAIALIACTVIYGGYFFKSRRHAMVMALVVLMAGGSMFVVKELAWNLKHTFSVACSDPMASRDKRPDHGKVTARVQIRPEQLRRTTSMLFAGSTYLNAFQYSEPMVTQAILNEIVRTEFHTPPADLVNQTLSAVPLGKSLFGIDVSETLPFNTRFQPELFPQVAFGMASNPWAQAYSAGGYGVLLLFAVGYALGLTLLGWWLARTPGTLRGPIAVIAAWWGFYVHRNDILVEVGILKMVLYLLAFGLVLSWLWDRLPSRMQSQQREQGA